MELLNITEQEETAAERLKRLRDKRKIDVTVKSDEPQQTDVKVVDKNTDVKKSIKPKDEPVNIELPRQPGNVSYAPRTKLDRNLLDQNLKKDIKRAAEAAGVNVQISYVRQGHKKHTSTGSISRHYSYNAVDISVIYDVSYRDDRSVFKAAGDKFVNELKNLGYVAAEGKNKKSYIWQVTDHYDHVHVSVLPDSTDVNPDVLIKQYKTKLDIHKKLQLLRHGMYDMFVKSPQDYFDEFKDKYTEDEEGAAQYVKAVLTKINIGELEGDKLGYNLNKWEKICWENDKKNIKTIRHVFNQIIKAILNEENPIIKVTYYKFNPTNNEWSTKIVKYPWTYL